MRYVLLRPPFHRYVCTYYVVGTERGMKIIIMNMTVGEGKGAFLYFYCLRLRWRAV